MIDGIYHQERVINNDSDGDQREEAENEEEKPRKRSLTQRGRIKDMEREYEGHMPVIPQIAVPWITRPKFLWYSHYTPTHNGFQGAKVPWECCGSLRASLAKEKRSQ